MPDTLFWIRMPPSAAEFAGDGEPGVGQERGDAVVGAPEDRLLETVAPAEHERVGVRVQIGDDPGRRGDVCRGVALVVDVHRLEEPAGRRRRQVHQRGIGARHDVRRAAFAGDGDLGCGNEGGEHRGCQPRRAAVAPLDSASLVSAFCGFSGRNQNERAHRAKLERVTTEPSLGCKDHRANHQVRVGKRVLSTHAKHGNPGPSSLRSGRPHRQRAIVRVGPMCSNDKNTYSDNFCACLF